jgi:hypothetical protein
MTKICERIIKSAASYYEWSLFEIMDKTRGYLQKYATQS